MHYADLNHVCNLKIVFIYHIASAESASAKFLVFSRVKYIEIKSHCDPLLTVKNKKNTDL